MAGWVYCKYGNFDKLRINHTQNEEIQMNKRALFYELLIAFLCCSSIYIDARNIKSHLSSLQLRYIAPIVARPTSTPTTHILLGHSKLCTLDKMLYLEFVTYSTPLAAWEMRSGIIASRVACSAADILPKGITSSTPLGPSLTGVEKKGALVRLFCTKVHSTTFLSPFMARKSEEVKRWPA
jgi:hypothetical protein